MSSPPLAALTVKPPEQQPGILQQAGQALSLKAMMNQSQMADVQLAEQKKAIAEQDAIKQAITNAGGDIRTALPEISKISPTHALQFGKELDEWDKADLDKKKSILELSGKKMERIGAIAGTMTDQPSYESGLDQAINEGVIDKGTYARLKLTPFDPETVKSFQTQALTAKDQLEQHAKDLQFKEEQRKNTATETETARHNKATEVPAVEREFQPYYESWLKAKGLQKNAKNELQARQEFANLKKSPGAQINLTGDAIDLAAQQYIGTGVMPALGMGNSGMRQQILNRAAEIQKGAVAAAAASGGAAPNDIPTNQAEFTAAKSPANVAFFGSANSLLDKGGTLEQLEKTAKDIPQHDFPVLNTIDDWQKLARGKGPLAGFAATALGVADDYSKVMTGGQGSDTARTQALNLISAAASPEMRAKSIKAIRDAVRSQKNSRIGANGQMKKIYSGNEDPRYQQPGYGKTLSKAQIAKAAADHKISVDEATKQAADQGYEVQ